MKLLLFSDLHCDVEAAERIVRRASDEAVDVAVGAGDFANLRRGIERTISVLRRLPCPAVLVPGNSESKDELQAACGEWPDAYVLHGTGTNLHGVAFFGLGGAVPVTPFGSWSYDLTEQQAEELLADCPPGCVLVTHSPPRGVVDTPGGGGHLGSETIRAAVARLQPRLVVCGHIHQSGGQCERLGTTAVVNAGPAGVLWNLEAGAPHGGSCPPG